MEAGEEDWNEHDMEVLLEREREEMALKSARRLDFEEERENIPPARNAPPQIEEEAEEASTLTNRKRKIEDSLSDEQSRDKLPPATQLPQQPPRDTKRRRTVVPTHAREQDKTSRSSATTTYSTRPLEGQRCMPVVSFSGRQVYVPMLCRKQEHSQAKMLAISKNSLLSVPIGFLLQTINDEKKHDTYAKITAGRHEGSSSDAGTDNSSMEEAESQLWVDKYAPKAFTELLSDEKTNREVFRWLKQWDECVFGTKRETSSRTRFSATSPRSWQNKRGWGVGAAGQQSFGNQKKKDNTRWADSKPKEQKTSNYNHYSSQRTIDNRPEPKVVLLTGPPGLGKTTLAHVLARQAGYNPVEINASDDRSPKVFLEKVLNATQMKSVFTADKRPNCLIIDEIDGVAGGEKNAIKELIKVVQAKDDPKDPKAIGKLKRPIICICNDQYAPALRKLREVAKVFSFSKPYSSRLVTRLAEICNKEGLSVDSQTLDALCDLSDCDVRSCLNTLQFIRRKSRYLTPELVTSAAVGHKDVLKSLFEIWKDIFRRPRNAKDNALKTLLTQTQQSKRYIKDALGREDVLPSSRRAHWAMGKMGTSHFDQLYTTISSHGECERIIDGCFENYPKFVVLDNMMDKTSQCLDSLSFSDSTTQFIRIHQDYSLQKYLPAAALLFHTCFATSDDPQVYFPRAYFDMQQTQQKHENVLHSFIQSASASILSNLSTNYLVLEMLSPMLDILSPSIRQLNPQLLDSEEKEILRNVVEIHHNFGLTYKPVAEDNDQQSSQLVMEPPLHHLVHFEGLDYGARHRQLTEGQKEMILSEVKQMQLKKLEERLAARAEKYKAQLEEPIRTAQETKLLQAQLRAKTQQLVPAEESHHSTTPAVRKDFFGRPILSPKKNKSSIASPKITSPKKSPGMATRRRHVADSPVGTHHPQEQASNDQREEGGVQFKFHEGFSNAVRRTVYVKDFL
ncbi:AAA domain-containing protein [Balamuthia mandrillaris]